VFRLRRLRFQSVFEDEVECEYEDDVECEYEDDVLFSSFTRPRVFSNIYILTSDTLNNFQYLTA